MNDAEYMWYWFSWYPLGNLTAGFGTTIGSQVALTYEFDSDGYDYVNPPDQPPYNCTILPTEYFKYFYVGANTQSSYYVIPSYFYTACKSNYRTILYPDIISLQWSIDRIMCMLIMLSLIYILLV